MKERTPKRSQMSFWDHVERFYDSILKDETTVRRPKDIRPTISYIRAVLEPNWPDALSRTHPLSQRLTMSSTQNDSWLEQFVSKIKAVQEIPNHDDVLKRLAQPAEYLGARFELDGALAFALNHFAVSFIKKADNRTPDLEIKTESSEYAVEVTSLNDSREFDRIDRISTHASFQVFKQKEGLVSGGVVINAPRSEEDLTKVLEEIDKTISNAIRTGYARMNIPGTAILYFAKPEFESSIPSDSRNQYRYGKLASPEVEDRIIRKIREKWYQIEQQGRPGLLLINTGYLGPDEIDTLFANTWDNVSVALSVYPRISALGVSCPKPLLSVPLRYAEANDKVSFSATIAAGENRNFYFWKNKHADVEVSPRVFEAFRNYATNLKSLASVS